MCSLFVGIKRPPMPGAYFFYYSFASQIVIGNFYGDKKREVFYRERRILCEKILRFLEQALT